MEVLAGITGATEAEIRRGGVDVAHAASWYNLFFDDGDVVGDGLTDVEAFSTTSPLPEWLANEIAAFVGGDPATIGRVLHFDSAAGEGESVCIAVGRENESAVRELFNPGGDLGSPLFIRDGIDSDNNRVDDRYANRDPFFRRAWVCSQLDDVEGKTLAWSYTSPRSDGLVLRSTDRSPVFPAKIWDPTTEDIEIQFSTGRRSTGTFTSPTIVGLLRDAEAGTADGRAGFGNERVREMVYGVYRTQYQPLPGTDSEDLDPGHVRVGEVFDALELACQAADQSGGGACLEVITNPPTVESVEDLKKLERFVDCAATAVSEGASGLVLTDLPADVAQTLASRSLGTTFPDNRGLQGEAIGELQGKLQLIEASTASLASSLRTFAAQMRLVRDQFDILELEQKIQRAETTVRISNVARTCANSRTYTEYFSNCLHGAVEHTVAMLVQFWREEITDLEQSRILGDALINFSDTIDAIGTANRNLSSALGDISSLLARIDRQQSAASRDAARVLGLERDSVGREYNVNRVMRARLDITRDRYDAARQRAVQRAWIARRAIEQRLGIDLSSLTSDLALVPAPSTWADRVCTFQGLDYSEFRDPDVPVPSYEDLFIGEYVTLLEDLVESYRFDFPFTDGDDTVVLSMRDDLVRTRASCYEPGSNLFAASSDLPRTETAELPGWRRLCDADGWCGIVAPSDSRPPFLFNDDGDGLYVPREGGGASATLLTVGEPLLPGEGGTVEPAPTEFPLTATSPGWGQAVTVEPGIHFLTWYEQLPVPIEVPETTSDACATECLDECGSNPDCVCRLRCESSYCAGEATSSGPALSVSFLPRSDFEPIPSIEVFDDAVFLDPTGDRWIDSCRWRRAVLRFRSPTTQTVTIGFGMPADVSARRVWAAPQLEVQPAETGGFLSWVPDAFFGTDKDALRRNALCPDTRGDRFRSGFVWKRACETVCSDGFGRTCESERDADSGYERCYREAWFNVDLNDIERGDLLGSGGFAVGNFNYRHVSMAVNVVGTALRDCERATNPDTCYSSGFIPYSIRHEGPYRVRNHRGEEYESPLFVGNIEHAKALDAERYLTNPISTADRALLSDFQRTEFLGRPLAGRYRIRIWDTAGLAWENVEDVQIALRYRYWTRFE